MRVILERIKPLEEKLKYQIEKMVKATISGKSGETDKNHYRANLADLEVSTRIDLRLFSFFFIYISK